ncbi:hypothetical protein ACP4OV_023956 [Aristida adscensionis]
MATHDALWAKLHDLEVQLAAYKLLRTARGEGAACAGGAGAAWAAAGGTCRGRQYDAYMRRRDARRTTAAAGERTARARQPRAAAGGARPMSPRGLRCAARDAQQEVRRAAPVVSVPNTPRRESAALPRSRTVNGGGGGAGATGSPARTHHHRRNSLGVLPELGDSGAATPRPFLRRGSGTGGAVAAPARARTPRVHDLPPSTDVPGTPRQPPPPQELARGKHQAPAAARHVRSVSELPFDTPALASPQARPRRRWASPERPPAAMLAAADSQSDFSRGLKKLLSFVRKGKGGGAAAADQHDAVRSPGGGGKAVSKGWSAAFSLVDVPLDRASLEGRRFATTRAVGISG